MSLSEVRKRYLEFFKSPPRNHAIIASASLVPEDDPTTLFTGSGMQPLVPYLLGETHPMGKRVANSQKSFRAGDIEEVGDNRHTTFFEMLGNWSFGDYFKEKQLSWFFEFLTDKESGVGLDPSRLYVSVFSGDEGNGIPRDRDSVAIWKRLFGEKKIEARDVEILTEDRGGELGMQGGRIFYYDAKKNWWSRTGIPQSMPPGEPGGPDSEVFFDFATPHDPQFGKECHPNCDCGRFLEIGNSVFMEYRKKDDGSFEKLPQRNVDFGGGLERITMAVNENPDMFSVNHASMIKWLERKSGKEYSRDRETSRAFRVVADHVKAASFLVAAGVKPGNTERNYLVRRLIRRASRYCSELGIKDTPLADLSQLVVADYEGWYTDLRSKAEEIRMAIAEEEEKFSTTLARGMREFEKTVWLGVADEKITHTSGSSAGHAEEFIPGKVAFDLYQTYGFPIELTEELAKEKKLRVDRDGFEEEMRKHQELSRTATAGVFKGGLADQSAEVVRLHTTTHLLNAALRKVLGDHVWQKGSNITKERTRFDFTHPEKLDESQKKEVERLVNTWIRADYEVKKEILPLEDARQLGAIGVFGEKYPDTVNVYTVWNPTTGEIISREFCGGPHVTHTREIGGTFRIAKEEAVAAGVRRIKGTVG